jgi:hypothetical protein
MRRRPLATTPNATLLEREDYTLVAWYRRLYAPRAGGAYDSHPSGALVRVQSATGRHDFLESGGIFLTTGQQLLRSGL